MADREDTDLSGTEESQDPAAFGNRPATGARLVDTAASLPTSFGGGQEATDFLGLSQELTGLEGGVQPTAETTDSFPKGFLPAGAEAEGPESSPSWLLSKGDGSESSEEQEAELEEESEPEPVATGSSRRIVSVAAALLVIGAAVTVAMRFGKHEEPAPLTAQRPAHGEPAVELSKPPKTHGGRETILPGGETVPVEEHATEVASSTPSPVEPAPEPTPSSSTVPAPVEIARPAGKRLAQWMARHGWSPNSASEDGGGADRRAGIAGWSAIAALSFGPRSPLAVPSAEGAEADPADGSGASPGGEVITGSGEAMSQPGLGSPRPAGGAVPAGAVRLASAEDLAGIWNANVVPMEALDSDTRMVTPGVGPVRVILKSGEIFDGRLYAVGQGQVWLETDIGRLAISARNVLRIDQVSSDKDQKAVESLPRMRVRTPGGLFFGKVISRDERHVTLMLEGGGRITLESTDVEPAPLGDTRVIGPEKQP